jgi:hypothetical protein
MVTWQESPLQSRLDQERDYQLWIIDEETVSTVNLPHSEAIPAVIQSFVISPPSILDSQLMLHHEPIASCSPC